MSRIISAPSYPFYRKDGTSSARSFCNTRFLLPGHMPDHEVIMRQVHSGVTRVEVDADVVKRCASEPRRLQ